MARRLFSGSAAALVIALTTSPCAAGDHSYALVFVDTRAAVFIDLPETATNGNNNHAFWVLWVFKEPKHFDNGDAAYDLSQTTFTCGSPRTMQISFMALYNAKGESFTSGTPTTGIMPIVPDSGGEAVANVICKDKAPLITGRFSNTTDAINAALAAFAAVDHSK